MMARLWLLARKEAREHAWALALMVTAFVILLGLRWQATRLNERAPSDMEGAQALISVFVPVAGLILGHRLVVREYQAKTQLFLEALPLRRWELVLVKFLFGLAFLSLLGWTAIAVFALLSRDANAKSLLIAGLRAFGFAAACWSFFFSFGLLGRLRFAAYATVALTALALSTLTDFEFQRFGPFALIDEVAFTYERSQLPWRALSQTLLSSAVLLVPGLFIALAREGSLAERLTRRGSAREVSAIAALLTVELMVAVWAVAKREEPPFEFKSAHVAKSNDGGVAIMYAFAELEPRAHELLGDVEALQGRLQSAFPLEKSRPIRIAQNGVLSGREVRPIHSDPHTIKVEVNLGARDFVATNVLMNVAHARLLLASRGRAAFEPNHWLLDGIASFMAGVPEGAATDQRWLRVAVAARRFEPDARAIGEWERLMERIGETQADALAFTLVDFMRQRHGLESTLALARLTLGSPSIEGFVSWLRLRDQTLERRFGELAHEPFSTFLLAWRGELRERAAGLALARQLARIPLDAAQLRVSSGHLGPEIEYVVSGPVLDRDRDCVLLHGPLRPYDIYYPPQQLLKEEFRVARGQTRFAARLRGRYAAGQRVYAAIECEVPELDAQERLLVARLGAP